MRPKTMTLVALAFALALAGSALFASHVPASLAQQEQRRKGTERVPGGCFICGNIPGVHTAMFEGANWFGTLAWDACPIKKYSEDHPNELKAVCQKIKADLKFTSFKVSCPSLAPYCEAEQKKAKCEEQKTPPWFDTGAKCDDPMMFPPVPSVRAEPHRGGVTCSISYTVCGFLMSEPRAKYFSTGPPNFFSRMSQAEADEFCTAKGFGRDTVPFRLTCCNKWNQAFTDWIAFRRQHGPDAPGHPCTPSIDADCDGTPNFQDPTPIGDCAEYPGHPSPSP